MSGGKAGSFSIRPSPPADNIADLGPGQLFYSTRGNRSDRWVKHDSRVEPTRAVSVSSCAKEWIMSASIQLAMVRCE